MASGLDRIATDLKFALRVLRADCSNFFLLQYRGVDAFLITGKNSGTHWLKYMLSCAIARQYGVPQPEHASGRASDAIIGHPRWPSVYPHLPRIGSSHTIPSGAFAWLPWLSRAPVVVVVRDMREALLSNYVKWRGRYGVSFNEYLRGDPSGRRFVADIWWYIHFFNRWGDVARRRPGSTLIVRYEDVELAPATWLRKIAQHLGTTLDDHALAAALPFVARDAVRAQLDPDYGEQIIPGSAERAGMRFSAEDSALFDATVRRYLRHDLGYDYSVRSRSAHPGLAAAEIRATLAR